MQQDDSSHWRDSSRQARFFFVDALIVFPLLATLMHITLTTITTAFVVMIFLGILEKFNFTLPVFFRFTKSFLAGPVKIAKPWWRK